MSSVIHPSNDAAVVLSRLHHRSIHLALSSRPQQKRTPPISLNDPKENPLPIPTPHSRTTAFHSSSVLVHPPQTTMFYYSIAARHPPSTQARTHHPPPKLRPPFRAKDQARRKRLKSPTNIHLSLERVPCKKESPMSNNHETNQPNHRGRLNPSVGNR